MKKKFAKRFLARNAHKIAKHNAGIEPASPSFRKTLRLAWRTLGLKPLYYDFSHLFGPKP